MPIDYSDPRPAYRQIADELRGRIDDGDLDVGDKLPSRKELADQYGVAPETIRKAQNELALEGLIGTQSTRGVFVLKKPSHSGIPPEYRRLMDQIQYLTSRLQDLESRVRALEDRS